MSYGATFLIVVGAMLTALLFSMFSLVEDEEREFRRRRKGLAITGILLFAAAAILYPEAARLDEPSPPPRDQLWRIPVGSDPPPPDLPPPPRMSPEGSEPPAPPAPPPPPPPEPRR